MSDTPRTDAATWVTGESADQDEVVHADFARKLERELAEAQRRLNIAFQNLEIGERR